MKTTQRTRSRQRGPEHIGPIIARVVVELWQGEIRAGKRTIGQADALARAAAWGAAGREDRAADTIDAAARVKHLLDALSRADGTLSLAEVREAAAREQLDEHGEMLYALLAYTRSGDILTPRGKARRRGAA